MSAQPRPDYETLDDKALAGLIAARDREAVRLVTQRNNQRLFRAAWSILRNRAEAEDAVQSAYLRAFAGIAGFEGRSSLSTWLTRIAINEALGRARAAKRRRRHLDHESVAVLDDYREKLMQGSASGTSPDGEYARVQMRALLEQAISGLPAEFRLVFVLREIEGLERRGDRRDARPRPGHGQDPPPARPPPAAAGAGAGNAGRAVRRLSLRRRRLRGDDRAGGVGLVRRPLRD